MVFFNPRRGTHSHTKGWFLVVSYRPNALSLPQISVLTTLAVARKDFSLASLEMIQIPTLS
jgi:hypothetical protein